MTGELPYPHILSSAAIPYEVGQNNLRPQRPKNLGVTNILWELWEACWSKDPEKRPSMDNALSTLQAVVTADGVPLRLLSIGRSIIRLRLGVKKTWSIRR